MNIEWSEDMSLSKATADAILNDYYRDEPIYLALFTTNPTPNATGTEVSGTGYVRQLITFTAPTTESQKETIKNTAEIQFPIAASDWGTVTHVAVFTAATAGTMISFGALQNARTILTGDRFVIPLDNGIIRLS
jgi:hypothetical protein